MTISKGRSPRAPVVETIKCSSREEAYQAYRRAKIDVLAYPDPLVTITATVEHQTDKAYLFKGDNRTVWVPKFVVTDNGDGTFSLPESWAYDKDLLCKQ